MKTDIEASPPATPKPTNNMLILLYFFKDSQKEKAFAFQRARQFRTNLDVFRRGCRNGA